MASNPNRASLASQQRLIDALRSDNARLAATIAELTAPPEPYIPIKAADHHGYHETTLLRWCERGLIDAKREGSRWFCRQSSINNRIKRLNGG
jgi:hypothetical protein